MKWLGIGVAAVVATAVFAQLLHGAPRVSGSTKADPQVFAVHDGSKVCQAGETSYAGTSAYQVTIGSKGKPTPAITLEARDADDHVVTRGRLGAGFPEGVNRIPLDQTTDRDAEDVTVCLTWAGPELYFGGETEPDGGRVSLIQLRPGKPSLLSSLDDAGHHYGRGNASWLGGWTLVAIALLALGGIAVAATALTSTGPRRAVVAFLLIGTAWALLIPPFHVPDETAHVAYVARIVEAGDLPPGRTDQSFSPEEDRLLTALDFTTAIGSVNAKPPWTAGQEHVVRAAEDAGLSERPLSAGSAGANPPLYYLLEAPVYAATSSTSLFDQVLAMRLLSVLLGALTVFFSFQFLRELLPDTPWAWPLGAVVVALQPLFGFMTAGVNADALLFAASSAVFWLVARMLRRGLDRPTALGLGAALAAGALTKPLFLAILPCALLALLVCAVRDRHARLNAVLAVGVLVVAVGLVAGIADLAFDHPYFQNEATVVAPGPGDAGAVYTGSRRGEVSYIWQLFAPRLPGMTDLIAGVPLRTTWFDGFVGRFGWLDYGFAGWVTNIALVIALILLVAAALAVWRARPDPWLLLCLLAGPVGVALVIGLRQYDVFAAGTGSAFTQPRYLLPLIALYGGLVAVAATAFRRWAPVVVIVLVGLAALHELSAMVLTVSRYYA